MSRYRKTEVGMHRRVAHRLRMRGWTYCAIAYLFKVSSCTIAAWLLPWRFIVRADGTIGRQYQAPMR